MTVQELIIFNSTLPEDQGFTILDHLNNVRVEREVIDGINVEIADGPISVDIADDTIVVDLELEVLSVDIADDRLIINIEEDELGVEYE